MPRTRAILIRLEPAEIEVLRAAAERAGLGLGPWLRSLGMREAQRDRKRRGAVR